MSAQERWTWENCRDDLRKLRGRMGFGEEVRFLGLRLSLQDGTIYDELKNRPYPKDQLRWERIYCFLSFYARAEPVPETSRLITSKQLKGGEYCPDMTLERCKSLLLEKFGSRGERLVKAARVLGGSEVKVGYGDYAVRLRSLPLVPITFVLTLADEEFPASLEILFDESISSYLDAEQVGMLTGLTAERLKDADELLG
ncbi:MAG: DUF3786 domain-containing protein [Candidatus Hadarchaeales archaeon]